MEGKMWYTAEPDGWAGHHIGADCLGSSLVCTAYSMACFHNPEKLPRLASLQDTCCTLNLTGLCVQGVFLLLLPVTR